MTADNPVRWEADGDVLVITIDNPPVNALRLAVREGLIAAVDTGFATTGLAVPFTQYFTEGESGSEGLTWQDVVDGTTGIEPAVCTS